MHLRFIDRSGDNLHRIIAPSITPDILEIMPPADEHPVPCKQDLVGKRRGERTVEINHHLSNPSFRWTHPPVVCGESKLPSNGRLHACAIKNLAFDL